MALRYSLPCQPSKAFHACAHYARAAKLRLCCGRFSLPPFSGINDALTTYADDVIACDLFRSSADFQQALRRFGMLLDTLEQFGLQISLDKTVAMLSLSGTQMKRLLQTHTVRSSTGHHLLIPRSNGSYTAVHRLEGYAVWFLIGATMACVRRRSAARSLPRTSWSGCIAGGETFSFWRGF